MLSTDKRSSAQVVELRRSLCLPAIIGNDDLINPKSIPIGDDELIRGRYRLSFRAYYQYFFCFNSKIENINSGAEDSGAAAVLRQAVSKGYDGNYELALTLAQRSFATDHRFGEASLIVGNVKWILHDRRGAAVAWNRAANTVGYPTPSADTIELYKKSAMRLSQMSHRGTKAFVSPLPMPR